MIGFARFAILLSRIFQFLKFAISMLCLILRGELIKGNHCFLKSVQAVGFGEKSGKLVMYPVRIRMHPFLPGRIVSEETILEKWYT